MSVNGGDPFEDGEGLDLTSEPTAYNANANSSNLASESNSLAESPGGNLSHVQVHFRCCKVYWRFPIPADVLSGAKESWSVYCPRCGGKLQLP